MTDAVSAHIKKVLYVMSPGPIPEDFALFGGFGILGGGDMVDNGLNLFGIENPIHPPGHQIGDGNWCGDFMTENPVQFNTCVSGNGSSTRCASNIFSAIVLPILISFFLSLS